jgi:hypothetical protein
LKAACGAREVFGARIGCHDLYLQALNRVTLAQMTVNDLVYIGLINIGVPNRFGINNHNRALITTIQAAGMVNADFVWAIQA